MAENKLAAKLGNCACDHDDKLKVKPQDSHIRIEVQN